MMFGNDKLNKAVELLKNKCGVIPEKYSMYKGSYLFMAYPPNTKNKEDHLSPYYLVNVTKKLAGPFSPAFDLPGFFKAADKLKDL